MNFKFLFAEACQKWKLETSVIDFPSQFRQIFILSVVTPSSLSALRIFGCHMQPMQLFPEFCPQFAILSASYGADTTSSTSSTKQLLSRSRGQVVFEPLRYWPRAQLFEQLHQRRIVIEIVSANEKRKHRNIPSEFHVERNQSGGAKLEFQIAGFPPQRQNKYADRHGLIFCSTSLLAKFLNILLQSIPTALDVFCERLGLLRAESRFVCGNSDQFVIPPIWGTKLRP